MQEKYKEYFPGEWGPLLKENETLLGNIHDRLNFEVGVENKVVYPSSDKVYRAFKETPLEDVNVIILLQDPYHDGRATGLCLDNHKDNKMSPSLQNYFKELEKDIPYEDNKNTTRIEYSINNSYLGHLPSQGVLLINTALTVEKSNPNSHKEIWAPFTKKVIEKLNTKDNIVWILWGANALAYKELITNETHKFVISSHPSPMSYDKKLKDYPSFKESRPFSLTNSYLEEMGKTPIKW